MISARVKPCHTDEQADQHQQADRHEHPDHGIMRLARQIRRDRPEKDLVDQA
jgi:hypothetical protein